MLFNKMLVVLALVTAAVGFSLLSLPVEYATASPNHNLMATANLAPPDGSQGITASLTFLDNGSRLRVTGTATGMDPNKHYHSLIYDTGSQPSGPIACIPSVLPPVGGLSFDQMQLGSWQPIGSSTRTINATRRAVAFVSLFQIGTASIRRHDQTGPAASLALVSCGAVAQQ